MKNKNLTKKEYDDYFIFNTKNIPESQLVSECLNYHKNSIIPKGIK